MDMPKDPHSDFFFLHLPLIQSLSTGIFNDLAKEFICVFHMEKCKQTIWPTQDYKMGFPCGSVVKHLPANAGDTGDMGSILEFGISPGGGSGNPLQYSCLENPVDGELWRATVHGIAESDVTEQLSMKYYK